MKERSKAVSLMRFHYLMGSVLGALVVSAALLAPVVHLSGFGQMLHTAPAFLLLAAVGYYCHWRGYARLVDVFFLTIWAVLLTNVLGVLIQIAARTPARLAETSLAQIDRRICFETAFIVQWISHFPKLQTGFEICYGLVLPLILAALFVPPLCGLAERSCCYVLAVTTAGLFTTVLFAIWPANGPWAVYGFAPSQAQADFISYLLRLKSGQPLIMDLAASAIVTFPSFHVVLAILSVVALWESGRARWPIVAMGTVICISTLTTGWHFLIDVIGGIGVACLSQALSTWAMSALTASQRIPANETVNIRELAA